VSRFETPCIPARCTGEQWSRCPGTMAGRARDSGLFATKLSRLGASEDRNVVHWCRTQASSLNSQGVVNGRVSEAGVSAAALDRSAIICC